MSFSNFEELTMTREQRVGVAIKVIDAASRAMHVGLLYAHSKVGMYFAHLAFHHDLRNDPMPIGQNYLWSGCAWLADPSMAENAKFMANYIEAVATQAADKVDYGVNPLGIGFDGSGQFRSLDPGKGLTCATFISAVFESAGFPIVKLSTWPLRPSDAAWRNHVLEMLASNGREDRAKQIANEEAPFRLTPAEAAAAASADTIPLDYQATAQLSEPLLQKLFPEPAAQSIASA
jgi:hypothetical protein